ncbi:MAG: outer membrane beta-barrel protein [Acidobacteria bacterium]|nr:outer membrane beta-barrel protein [Acidobacteriota bacterium]
MPIRWGRVYFFPSVTISHGWEDNVQRLSEEAPVLGPIESGVGDVQPLLRFELPYRKSLLRLVYRGDFRTYSADILKDAGGMSHFVDFESHFEVGQRMRIDAAVRYADTITAMLASAPGGEYQYGTQPVEAKEARLGTAVDLGWTQSLEFGAVRGEAEFQPSITSRVFTDNSFQNLYFRYVLESGPQNQIYLSWDRQDVQQNQDGLNSLVQPGEYRVRSVGAGFRRTTGKDLSSEIRVAYSTTDFTEGIYTPFQGVTLEGVVNLAPSPQTQLQLRLRRAPQVSFFNVSSYYLNEAIDLNFNRALGRMLALRLALGSQRNTYSDPILVLPNLDGYLQPSAGEIRQDRITNASLIIFWHASRSMDLSLGYGHQQARSNVEAQGVDSLGQTYDYHIYDFENHGLILSATLGWQ